jgi:hypothetical protein
MADVIRQAPRTRPTRREAAASRSGRRSGAPYVVALLALDAMIAAWVWPTLTRPVWYDEAWRAYHISIGAGWFAALKTANAPLPGGWFAVERLSVALFGNTAFVLRLPELLTLPALTLLTYTLGRWWLPRPVAAVTAAALTLNGSVLVYGLQVKSYLPEAACSAAVIHLWLSARRASDENRAPWPYQLGLAVCSVTTLTSLLVLAPLLLIDLADAVRGFRRPAAGPERPRHAAGRRRPRAPVARLPGAAATGVVALAHLRFFVMPQSYLVTNPYWQGFFVTTHDVLPRVAAAFADLVKRSMTAALTKPDGQFGSPFTGSPLLGSPRHWIVVTVGLGLVGCAAAGTVAAARSRDGRALLAALAGAGVLIVVAGFTRQWPVGWVRANLFLLPPLYVLAATGALALVRWGEQFAGGSGDRKASLITRTSSKLLRRRGALVAAPVVGWALLVCAVGAHWTDTIRVTAHAPLLLGDMDRLVAVEAAGSEPGDIQIVVPGRRDPAQWYKAQQYVARYAGAHPRGAVTDADTLLLEPTGWNPPIDAFLSHHRQARALYVVTYNLVAPPARGSLVARLSQRGWCTAGPTSTWPLTGSISRLTRCARNV